MGVRVFLVPFPFRGKGMGGGHPPGATKAGGMHPTGMLSC